MKDKLKSRLKEKLPGYDAHLRMSPSLRNVPFRKFKPGPNPKKSAVMVLLSEDENKELQVILTLRGSKLENHSRQISFPGGMSEEGETPVDTAKRETFEEIGVKPYDIEIIGQLSQLYVPPSNFLIVPIVGWTHNNHKFKINYDEVEELFFVKVKELIDENSIMYQKRNLKGEEIDVPYWSVHPEVPLWGATAMMLNEFIHIIKTL